MTTLEATTKRAPAQAVGAVLDAVRTHARDTDEAATFPTAALGALRDSGLLGLLVPAEYGGMGGGTADLAEVSGLIAREDLSAGLVFAMHCQQVAAVARHAGPALREMLLPKVARGEAYLASVTTESGKGGHLMTSHAPLLSGGDTLGIDRFAPVVTGAQHADGFLVTMRAPDTDSPAEVSLVYADRSQLEITEAGGWDPMGMRASHSPPVKLTGAVPAHQVIGRHGGFRDIAVQVFAPLAHIGWAACWLGATAGALSRTVTHLRSADGRRSHDLTSELLLSRLGRVRGGLDLVHALLVRCVDLVERETDLSSSRCQLPLNALKIAASEQCFAAVHELVELAGLRHGYMKNSPLWLERVFRDLRSASLNYHNDRLLLADGRLALLDPGVHLV